MADGIADEVIQADIEVAEFFTSIFFDHIRYGGHDGVVHPQQTCHN